MYQSLSTSFDVYGSVRGTATEYYSLGIFDPRRLVEGVDANNFEAVVEAVSKVEPEVIINCIGIIKQLRESQDPIRSLSINSLFPQRLALLCRARKVRLIHISTDCVFSGLKGSYREDDIPDAEDLYGQTKFLGEVGEPPALTLRTSIIGRELRTTSGLIEWFLSNRNGKVRGFTKAMYTGLTTIAISKVVRSLIRDFPTLSGTYHLSSERISKYDLLTLVRNAYNLRVEILPDESVIIDRTLNSERFRQATGFQPPSWAAMIGEMAEDPTPYDEWRSQRVS